MTAQGLEGMSYKIIRERLITFQESSTVFSGERERPRDRQRTERPPQRRDVTTGYVANKDTMCYNCGKHGHYASDCRSQCKRCSEEGKGEHSRKECPNNKRGQAFIGKRGGRFTSRGRGQPSSNIGFTQTSFTFLNTIEDETIAAMRRKG